MVGNFQELPYLLLFIGRGENMDFATEFLGSKAGFVQSTSRSTRQIVAQSWIQIVTGESLWANSTWRRSRLALA